MILNYEYDETIIKYTDATPEEILEIRNELKPFEKRKDSIFKTIFQDKKMFLMFIQSFVKQDWVNDLTEENLEYHPSLFPEILETDRESDIVYKVKRNHDELFVFIMLENQSKVDFLMPFRLLEYMVRLWRRYIQDHKKTSEKQGFKLPAILPILFFDGDQKSGWTAETEFINKVEEKELFEKYIPNFEYVLVDLTKISVEDLKKLKNPQSFILILDKIRKQKDVKTIKELDQEYFDTVKTLLEKNGLMDLFTQVIYLFMKKNHIEDGVINDTITKLRKGGFEEGMFAYSEALDVKKAKENGIQIGIEKGLEKGLEKGFEKALIRTALNLYKMGLSLEQISEGTNLSVEKVKNIIQKDANKNLN
jgi:predicted transposase/invertase (TIGR01784 family)